MTSAMRRTSSNSEALIEKERYRLAHQLRLTQLFAVLLKHLFKDVIDFVDTLHVQFFFSETKTTEQVSRFWLWDSRFENPVVDVEKRPPYLPQDRRSRSDPYLGIPPL